MKDNFALDVFPTFEPKPQPAYGPSTVYAKRFSSRFPISSIIKPRRKTPGTSLGDISRVPFVGLWHWGL